MDQIQPVKDTPSTDDVKKDLNDWLPITQSRNAKWWYSAFHNVTAMVGAGVLGLPYAMSQLGWGPGAAVLILSWVITLYTLYHELGQHAFGEKLGLWVVVPQQLMVEVGSSIVYMITGGKSLKKAHDTIWPDYKEIKLTYFIMIFSSVHFVISHLPSFNSITAVSLVAAVMSLSYSTIAWVVSWQKGVQPDVQYTSRASTNTGQMFDSFSALGDIAFAFAGHSVALEIQATIPSTPGKPSKKPMWRGVVVAYLVVALCYLPVSFIGYWVFGNKVEDNILLSLEKPRWLVAAANLFVVIHVIGSYQVFAMPVFDMMEAFLVLKMKIDHVRRNDIPIFWGLLSFFGGFAFAPTSYYLPCVMWLAVYKPKKFSLSWLANWICIILGFVLMVLAPIGALRQIILQARDFQFYS
ncbi:hypothetical protein NC651_033003 [Populus alba x Populus x berolinensis]|nr:hypothetical protein NC651_033003 [Populus alba x Populus x berolinensis]